ncbi:barstar family protein [Candidatus Woesearchaeota archaeon]|nr:barstar family protein [Candidatus Woesearchaeota archaeon]
MKKNDKILRDHDSLKYDLKKQNYIILEIDGSNIENESMLFQAFSQSLKFPDYFGRNWNALYDCLTDLMWIKGKWRLAILIKNYEKIKKRDYFTLLFDVLHDSQQFWNATNNKFKVFIYDNKRVLNERKNDSKKE